MIAHHKLPRVLGCAFGVLAASLGCVASAANLTLATTSPIGSPTEFFSGGVSPPIGIAIVNDAIPDATEDYLTGWQLALRIVPQPGATGSVEFASPVGPTAAEPPNYVLDGINFGISATNSGDELLAFDFNFPASGGVEVSTTPEDGLVTVELASSIDAVGTFDIVAVAGPGLTEWTDAATPIQQVRRFLNVPVGIGTAVIGRVIVEVPEPHTITATACLLVAALSWRLRRPR